MKTAITMTITAALTISGCTVSGNGEGSANCGSGMGGEGAGTTADTGGGGVPGQEPSTAKYGFGGVTAPCVNGHLFAEHGPSAVSAGIVSVPVRMPVSGTVVRATVVHLIDGNLGVCDAAPRSIVLSEPTKTAVPEGPAIRQEAAFSEEDIVEAPVYEVEGVATGRARSLGFDLDAPMHVEKGEYVHVGSILAPDTACFAGCDQLSGGGVAPDGDALCAKGESWSDCASQPVVTGDFYLAHIAWIDVVPDAK